jgi:Mannosyltransferase (PIG-V)
VERPPAYAQPRTEPLDVATERVVALRDAWRAFALSRALIWAVGIAAVLAAGAPTLTTARLDPFWFTEPFQASFANLVVAPSARWDSAWFLQIASFGYDDPSRRAFFPLYPLLVALWSPLGSALVVGIVVSCVSSLGGLYVLHRLVSLDFELQDARTTVAIVAWFPSAIVLSAVYSEGLFLLLSVASIYAARLGRWPLAGLLAALGTATRSAGILLIIPLVVMYLYGPRPDRAAVLTSGWRPRYPLRRDALWIALVPVGLLAYAAYLGFAEGDVLGAFIAQTEWQRLPIPLGGIALGLWSGLEGLIELLPGFGAPDAALTNGQVPEAVAIRDLAHLGFLALAVWLALECRRRLPTAYTLYAVSGLLLPLSMPATSEPLKSLPRFMMVLFPLWIALALWARERGWTRQVIAGMGVLLAVSTALFTTWVYAP